MVAWDSPAVNSISGRIFEGAGMGRWGMRIDAVRYRKRYNSMPVEQQFNTALVNFNVSLMLSFGRATEGHFEPAVRRAGTGHAGVDNVWTNDEIAENARQFSGFANATQTESFRFRCGARRLGCESLVIS